MTGEKENAGLRSQQYLNALEGKGVHVVTVNDYLASYQSQAYGAYLPFPGDGNGCIITDQQPAERRKQYNTGPSPTVQIMSSALITCAIIWRGKKMNSSSANFFRTQQLMKSIHPY